MKKYLVQRLELAHFFFRPSIENVSVQNSKIPELGEVTIISYG